MITNVNCSESNYKLNKHHKFIVCISIIILITILIKILIPYFIYGDYSVIYNFNSCAICKVHNNDQFETYSIITVSNIDNLSETKKITIFCADTDDCYLKDSYVCHRDTLYPIHGDIYLQC